MADGHHLENRYDAIFQRRMFRFGRNSEGWCRITCRLREVVEIKPGSRIPIWRTFVFRNRKYLYLSREWRYLDEIWFADRLWPSEDSDINKYETGSSILRSRSPSWGMDMMSYFRSGCSDLGKIRQPDAEWHGNYEKWSLSKPKVEFQYGGRLFFSKTEVVKSQPSIEICWQNLVWS